MISALSTDNVISWLLQVSAIAFLGALLPLVFRIRHPRSHLAYCHVILAACFLLPLIQPWHDPLVVMTRASVSAAADFGFRISWGVIALAVIGSGFVAKLCWLAMGMRQILNYRKAAVPLCPTPEAIRVARKLTRADAGFRISSSVSGPATVGYVDPVILLPESFLLLEPEAQQSIACHELLHVRRNDWIVTVFEEVVCALFWFNPAVRWLLSQAKLSREELVDAEVVELTGAPRAYIQALLSMAETPKSLNVAPAALFLGEGHLTRRVRSLLRIQRESLFRLATSYASIAGLLALTGWCACTFFPLIGEAQVVTALAPAPPVFVPQRTPDRSRVLRATFNVRVPAPTPSAPLDVMLPAPPAPPRPPFGRLIGRGVRIFRPGDKPMPEEIAQMQAALSEHALVEVTQAEDGTVQRIIIQSRRSPDEIGRVPSYFFVSPVGPGPAGPADGIH